MESNITVTLDKLSTNEGLYAVKVNGLCNYWFVVNSSYYILAPKNLSEDTFGLQGLDGSVRWIGSLEACRLAMISRLQLDALKKGVLR